MIKKVEIAIIIPWKYISLFFVVCKGSDYGAYTQMRRSEIEGRGERRVFGSEDSGMAHAQRGHFYRAAHASPLPEQT